MAGKKQSKRDRGGTSRRTKVAAGTRRGRLRKEFTPDYSYVKKDLTRISLLTGVFLTILIILSFILR
jgi:hypothetical protein